MSLMDMLNNDDPLSTGADVLRTATQSRSSLASSLSPPPSTTSYADRSSTHSARPLLGSMTPFHSGEQSNNGHGNTAGSEISRRERTRTSSSTSSTKNGESSTPYPLLSRTSQSSRRSLESWDDGVGIRRTTTGTGVGSDGNGSSLWSREQTTSHRSLRHASSKDSTGSDSAIAINGRGSSTLDLGPVDPDTQQPRRAEEQGVGVYWSDPFEDSNEARWIRRRSTVSGYSVSSTDWLNMRRGSLASLETASIVSRPAPGSVAVGNSVDPFQSAEGTSSMRWEAWASAYRDSMLPSLLESEVPVSVAVCGSESFRITF